MQAFPTQSCPNRYTYTWKCSELELCSLSCIGWLVVRRQNRAIEKLGLMYKPP